MPVVSKAQKVKRSPLFYVGDKYKILPQLLSLFPTEIEHFYEPFVGGGSVFLNVTAKRYFLNDVSSQLIGIHKFLYSHAHANGAIFRKIDEIASTYGLSQSYKGDVVPTELKKEFVKTYYAQYNRSGYNALKAHVNNGSAGDPLLLYVLLIYGFNRMLRFNREGMFNLPVGNVDFNKNVVNALNEYFDTVKDRQIDFSTDDFEPFLSEKKYQAGDFVYIDPPYLLAASEYNKLWSRERERELLTLIDELDAQQVKFALSNVTHYNGRANDILMDWIGKYQVHEIDSNYINYHDNGKKRITEILVTNY